MNLIKKKVSAGCYRVLVDGRPTAILILKSIAPRYGMPQTWDVVDEADPDGLLFDANGLDSAMTRLARIGLLLTKAGE